METGSKESGGPTQSEGRTAGLTEGLEKDLRFFVQFFRINSI